MRWRRAMAGAIMAWMAMASTAAAERPIFRVGAEQATPGAFQPSGALLTAALEGVEPDDRQELKNCSVEKHTRGLGPFFSVRRIRGEGRDLYFVRGSLRPFCMALFGAHAFRWSLVEGRTVRGAQRFRTVHTGGGDQVAVYPTRHNGLNDVESLGCTAVECWGSRLVWNGRAYKAARCWIETVDGDRTVTNPRRCDEE